jgi:Uma2 family endonuclease
MERREPPTRLVSSAEEYLQLEEAATERHEFVDGAMFMMAGGSVPHSQIALRLAAKLLEATDDTDCEVVNSDVKLQIGSVYYYPDVMVSCQEDRLERRFFKHPCAIIEVLSESTAPIDRGEKLLRYRTIPSLQSYVLLAQDTARAEVYRRMPDGSWRYDVLEDDATLEIPCAGLNLPVSSLYRGVLPLESP